MHPHSENHFSIHSDNHNSHGACTTSRVQHTPPSFSLWQHHHHHHHHRILQAIASPHQPPTHSKPSPMRKPYRSMCAVEELERRQREKEEPTPVVKEENRKISPFPHRHDRSESHAAPAIQQPVVEQEQQVQGVSAVPPPPSEGPLLSKAMDSPSRAMDSLPVLLQNQVVLLRKGGLSVA
jgi:hypothetical protein